MIKVILGTVALTVSLGFCGSDGITTDETYNTSPFVIETITAGDWR